MAPQLERFHCVFLDWNASHVINSVNICSPVSMGYSASCLTESNPVPHKKFQITAHYRLCWPWHRVGSTAAFPTACLWQVERSLKISCSPLLCCTSPNITSTPRTPNLERSQRPRWILQQPRSSTNQQSQQDSLSKPCHIQTPARLLRRQRGQPHR